MFSKSVRRSIILVIILVVITGCIVLIRKKSAQENSSKIEVATSFYPLFYFAQAIGGEKAHVVNITPAGAEPHEYEPTAQDLVQIEKSRIIIVNGNNLEPWSERVHLSLQPSQTLFVVAGEGLATEKMEEDGFTILDPHVWLSPVLAERMVDTIASAFETVDPENIPYYQINADIVKTKLQNLDHEFMTSLTSCQTRNFVTSHAAFGYLAKDFNLKQTSITGVSPEAEPSQQTLSNIADFVKKNNIKYIFSESLLSPKLSETLAEETGAQTLVLNPLEGLTAEEKDSGEDYFSIMRKNLAHLQTALQCQK